MLHRFPDIPSDSSAGPLARPSYQPEILHSAWWSKGDTLGRLLFFVCCLNSRSAAALLPPDFAPHLQLFSLAISPNSSSETRGVPRPNGTGYVTPSECSGSTPGSPSTINMFTPKTESDWMQGCWTVCAVCSFTTNSYCTGYWQAT